MVCAIDVPATGMNIKHMMMDRGVTVKELSAILGFTTGTAIYKWFYGQNLPTVDNLLIISRVLGVKIDDIIIVM